MLDYSRILRDLLTDLQIALAFASVDGYLEIPPPVLTSFQLDNRRAAMRRFDSFLIKIPQ
jgi:hypothetical protein